MWKLQEQIICYTNSHYEETIVRMSAKTFVLKFYSSRLSTSAVMILSKIIFISRLLQYFNKTSLQKEKQGCCIWFIHQIGRQIYRPVFGFHSFLENYKTTFLYLKLSYNLTKAAIIWLNIHKYILLFKTTIFYLKYFQM